MKTATLEITEYEARRLLGLLAREVVLLPRGAERRQLTELLLKLEDARDRANAGP